uniref:AlNc14C94G5800 protein n=1 Tax=Albugo laibachii Nc14 TaxID=890382 RepID=F0WGS3_9STRA|nr:AlNc14C94G5800 [Albugo laibachii Nc14]|eukprot:CCA20437.1 AlNc14C94G5800 [Albugo laibachii Nc14]
MSLKMLFRKTKSAYSLSTQSVASTPVAVAPIKTCAVNRVSVASTIRTSFTLRDTHDVTSPQSVQSMGSKVSELQTWMYWKQDPFRSESWVKVFATLEGQVVTLLQQQNTVQIPLVEMTVARVEVTSIGGLLIYDVIGRIFEFYLYQNTDDRFFGWYEALLNAAEQTVDELPSYYSAASTSGTEIEDIEMEQCMPCSFFQKLSRKRRFSKQQFQWS